MEKIIIRILIVLFISSLIIGSEPINPSTRSNNSRDALDRAKGYLMDGEAKSAIANFGNFMSWDDDYTPSGLWREYAYVSQLGFKLGVPGHAYSSSYSWQDASDELSTVQQNSDGLDLFCSEEVYNDWSNYKVVVFAMADDRGTIGQEVDSSESLDEKNQWFIDDSALRVCISLSKYESIDPNQSSARIGLAYPWSIRPAFLERLDDYDAYNYGEDQVEWTVDDVYEFYGTTVSESYFTRNSEKDNIDWDATPDSRLNTHQMEFDAGDLFGDQVFSNQYDTDPLLAHSHLPQTWPLQYNSDSGLNESFWPGWWAKNFYGDQPDVWSQLGISNCSGTTDDQDCWAEDEGRFTSLTDIYFEFDDRLAHRGNMIENNQYLQTGYPLGIKVKNQAYSFNTSNLEDILLIRSKIINESGAYYDENDEYHQGMLMPDGTQINNGLGFDYINTHMGLYFDADVLMGDINGYNSGLHTNNDDFMEYYNETFEFNGDNLVVSLGMIYDWDGFSGFETEDVGIVAIQLLETPLAADNIDLNGDGATDIYAGEELKMTNWHWFDWYNRPGVVNRESSQNCCAGDPGMAQALNKEAIMYKVMSGDTTNLSADEKHWFFHTSVPSTDIDLDLNPHFDSLEGLAQETIVNQDPYGMDCVFELSTGPFNLPIGEEVLFSFAVIFGEDKEDLINNAKQLQILYNYDFVTFSGMPTPELSANIEVDPFANPFDNTSTNSIILNWDTSAEEFVDILSGLQDFEGYKLYRSIDGGDTWGDSVFNDNGDFSGWVPYVQFDLNEDEDIETFGYEISGPDPLAPWIDLGSNTGISDIYIDENISPNLEYCYILTAYDSGYLPGFTTVFGYDIDYGVISNESDMGENMVCISPLGLNISNINHWIIPSDNNYGPNFIDFIPVDDDVIINNVENNNIYKLDIFADSLHNIEWDNFLDPYAIFYGDDYNSIRSFEPKLYVYEIDEDNNPVDVNFLSFDTVNQTDSIPYYLEFPGANEVDNQDDNLTTISIPEYIISDFPIQYKDQDDHEYNYVEFGGGYFRLDNYYSTYMPEHELDFDESLFNDLDIIDNNFGWMREYFSIQYGLEGSAIIYRNPYNYLIEFGELGLDTAAYSIPTSGCVDNGTNTLLPFRITNLTTNKKVGLYHVDKGGFYEESFEYNLWGTCIEDGNPCSVNQYCDVDVCIDLEGYGDCIWQRNEQITLKDSVVVYHFDDDIGDFIDDGIDDEYIYDFFINWDESIYTDQFPWSSGDEIVIHPRKHLRNGDYWIMDFNILHSYDGELSNDINIPSKFELSHAFPNPFNPVTNIKYSIPIHDIIKISIYDLLGREVEKIYEGLQAPGEYIVEWDASNFSTGIYFVNMKSNNFTKTQKIMLIK